MRPKRLVGSRALHRDADIWANEADHPFASSRDSGGALSTVPPIVEWPSSSPTSVDGFKLPKYPLAEARCRRRRPERREAPARWDSDRRGLRPRRRRPAASLRAGALPGPACCLVLLTFATLFRSAHHAGGDVSRWVTAGPRCWHCVRGRVWRPHQRCNRSALLEAPLAVSLSAVGSTPSCAALGRPR